MSNLNQHNNKTRSRHRCVSELTLTQHCVRIDTNKTLLCVKVDTDTILCVWQSSKQYPIGAPLISFIMHNAGFVMSPSTWNCHTHSVVSVSTLTQKSVLFVVILTQCCVRVNSDTHLCLLLALLLCWF